MTSAQLVDEVSVHGNGDTIQVYFPLEFLARTELVFPPLREETALAQVIPHTGVLLFPATDPPDYPLTVREPSRIAQQLTTSLEDIHER